MMTGGRTPKRCPRCGKPLETRHGTHGTYLDCTGYPKCKYTQDLSKIRTNKTESIVPAKCPKCGKKFAIYAGKFGIFLGCNGYPNCNYSYSFKDPTKISCPECGKNMRERTGKYGTFYGCSGYPDCKFTFDLRIKKKKIQDTKKILELPQDSTFTTGNILKVLSDKLQDLQKISNKLNLNDKMDVKFLQLKLKELERKEIIEMNLIDKIKFWKKS